MPVSWSRAAVRRSPTAWVAGSRLKMRWSRASASRFWKNSCRASMRAMYAATIPSRIDRRDRSDSALRLSRVPVGRGAGRAGGATALWARGSGPTATDLDEAEGDVVGERAAVAALGLGQQAVEQAVGGGAQPVEVVDDRQERGDAQPGASLGSRPALDEPVRVEQQRGVRVEGDLHRRPLGLGQH